MRVLHLIDAASPQASPTTLALMGESLGRLGHVEQEVLILGPTALGRAAQAVGIPNARTIGVPWGRAIMGWPAARQFMRERRRNDGFDLLHCWSVGTFSLASLAWRSIPRVLTLTTAPSPRAIHWLRMLTGESAGRTAILPISSTIRRDVLSGGLLPQMVHVLRPGLDLGKVAPDQRAVLRTSWGIDPDDPASARIKVVALLGDPPQAADAEAAHMAVGLADETYLGVSGQGRAEGVRSFNAELLTPSAPSPSAPLDPGGRGDNPELRLLVHPEQFNRRRAERVVRDIGKPLRIIQEPLLARPWEILPGCDLALAQGPNAGGLSLLWAMAGNVPIVGEATYAVSEIVEDHHSALLAKPGQPRLLAHRITQLLADPHLAWQLRDAARHEAYSFFSRQRYCQSLQGVYEQLLAGHAVAIPEMPSTGGLRFAGRA